MIISSVVSIISIFISNYLGQILNRKHFEFINTENVYKTFYIPLIKWVATSNRDFMTYFWKIGVRRYADSANEKDWLQNHLGNNLEFALPSVAEKYAHYLESTSGAEFFYSNINDRKNYERYAQEASDLFDQIIIESLLESSRLSKKLKYPDISTPILELFLKGVNSHSKTSRYMPEQYSDNMPTILEYKSENQ